MSKLQLLIEAEKRGKLPEKYRPLLDEAVRRGRVTPEQLGRKAAQDAGVAPGEASGVLSDIAEAVKSVPRGLVGAARATAEDPGAMLKSAAKVASYSPALIPARIAGAGPLIEKAMGIGEKGVEAVTDIPPIKAVTKKAADLLHEAEVHPAIAASPEYSAGMDIFEAMGKGEYAEAAKSLGHTALANSGITATALLVGRYNPAAAKKLMATEIYGQSYQGLTAEGIDKEDAHNAALMNALGQMPLEALGLDAILSPKLMQSMLGTGVGMAARVAGGSVAEGVTEFLQVLPEAISTEWARTEGTPKERFKKTFEVLAVKYPEYLRQGIVEGMVGMLIGGPLTGVQVASEKKAAAADAAKKEALGLPNLEDQMKEDDANNSQQIVDDFNTIIQEAARTEQLNKELKGKIEFRGAEADAIGFTEDTMAVEEEEEIVAKTPKKTPKKVAKKAKAKKPVVKKETVTEPEIEFTGEGEIGGKTVYHYKLGQKNFTTLDQKPATIKKAAANIQKGFTPKPVVKKPTKKALQKRGRKSIPQYSVQKDVDTGEFQVRDRIKKGEVVQSFKKKKDAEAFLTSSDMHREFEKAYVAQQKIKPSPSIPLPKSFKEYKPEDIQDIPEGTPLPKVGRSLKNKRATGKVWYPVTGAKTDMTTSSPFQFAIEKKDNKWNITWKGDSKIHKTITSKYGLPLNEQGFKNADQANKRAEQIIRHIVKVYKGENITGEKPVIAKKDLVLKKFGKQNILVRMKKSLMDYYPVKEIGKTTKVSSLPEYRIYTKFDKGLNQFVYFVQRKQAGTPNRSSRALFTTGKAVKGANLVNSVQDVKAWLLERIEKNGYYNALPTDDTTDIKARLEGLQLEGGATPAKPKETIPTEVTEEVVIPKADATKFNKEYLQLKAELAGLEVSDDSVRIKELDKERLMLEANIETIQESVEEIEDDYSDVFGKDIETPVRQELETLEDNLTENKLEYQTILDRQNLRKTQLETILKGAAKAFEDKDITSALAMLEQAGQDIKVTKKVAEPSAVADVSLTSQIRHHDRLQEAAAEQIETSTEGTIGYSQLHPQWSRGAAKNLNGYTVYTSQDSKHSVVQYWDTNGELQYVVVEKKASKRGYTVWKNGETTPETKQAVSDVQKHFHETMKDVTPFVPGEIMTVSEGITKKTKTQLLPERFLKYTKDLMKLMKLTDIQVFVAYEHELLGKRGDKYGMYGKYFQYREPAVTRKDALGTLSKPADTKGKYVIQLKSGMSLAQTVRTFVHELGHIIYYEHFSRATAATKRSIVKDWNKWKNNIKLGKVTYGTMVEALEALQSSKQHTKVQARLEMKSFNEWFANRVREQLISEEKLGGNLATRFFKGIAKDMMKWVKQVMGISNERDAVREFLKSVVRSKSLREIGLQVEKSTSWEKAATQDAAIGPQVSSDKKADTVKTVTDYVKSEHIYKPNLKRNKWSLLDSKVNPRESEMLMDIKLGDITIEEDLITNAPKENTPLDWQALKNFAQPYWVKKQFQFMREKVGLPVNQGFSKIFDVAINSRRKLSKVLEQALKNNKEFFNMKSNSPEMQQLTEVIYDLDSNPDKLPSLPNKFVTALDEKLGMELATGLNQEHYDALKDFVMTQMESNNLSPELAEMFVNIRKSLDRALLRLQNMVKDSVKRGDTDEESLREMLDQKIMNQLQAYFPHVRFGDTYILGLNSKGETVVRYHFNKGLFNQKKRLTGTQIAKQTGLLDKPGNEGLKWTNPKVVKDDSITSILNTPIPIDAMNAFVKAAMGKLKNEHDVDSAARQAFESTFTQAIASQMGETGYRKHFLQRKNIAGYSKDAEDLKQVLHQYLTNVYGSMNKMETMREFSNEFAKINPETNPEEWKYSDNYISTYFNHLDEWVTQWKKLAFTWYLGARVSTATLNLTQNFITGVQKLNMDAGVSEPVMMKWLWDSGRNLADLARTRGVPVFVNKRIKLPGGRQMSAAEINLIRELYENHDAQDQLIQEMKGQATGVSLGGTAIDKLGGFMSFAERQNRVSIALTAFRLATTGKIQNAKTAERYGYKAGQKFSEEDATQYAEDVIADTHWHYGKENLPKFFRDNPKWQTVYVFKSFPMNLMLLLREWSAHEGGRGLAAVFGSLVWAALYGGLKGLPFEEEIDFLMKKFKGTDWKYNMRKKLAENNAQDYSDILFTGLPSWFKVDLSGSIGTGFSGTQSMDPTENTYKNSIAFAEGFIGVPAAFVRDMVESYEYAKDRDYWKSLEKASPKFIASALKGYRVYNKGLISKKGYKVNFPFNMEPYKYTLHESIIKTMGFTPTSEGKLFEKGEIIRFQENLAKSKIDGLATRVANESLEVNEAFAAITEWNKNNKDNRINHKDLVSALKARMTNKQDKMRLLKKLNVAKLFKED